MDALRASRGHKPADARLSPLRRSCDVIRRQSTTYVVMTTAARRGPDGRQQVVSPSDSRWSSGADVKPPAASDGVHSGEGDGTEWPVALPAVPEACYCRGSSVNHHRRGQRA